MKLRFLAASIFTIGLGCAASAVEIKSPSGGLVLTVDMKDFGDERNCPFFRLIYKGRTVLTDSRLGLDLEPDALATNLEITAALRSQQDTTWKPVCGEREVVRDHYNAVQIDLTEQNKHHRLLRLTFRVYDEGIAFCYTLPEQPNIRTFTLGAEQTQFAFTANHNAWAVYRAQGNYDGGRIPISRIKPGAERPLTIEMGNNLFAVVTEARCVDYARMKLRVAESQPNTLEPFLDGEQGKAGKVTGTAPFTTPWRVILVAESAGKLLENNDLILNLNDPCALADTAWIRPGKVIRDTTLTTVGAKACVDFCRQRGMQYVLFDAGWYGPEGDGKSDASAVDPKKADSLNLQEVIRYGNDKGIGVILYVNRRALEKQMDEIFPLYEKWSVKGVKFGFVNVGSQKWTTWVHEGIRKAAAHRLMVDIHDEFRDTGYRRTYPNLMTVEGIYGNEEFPTPAHNATLPFTRFLTGPADYTYCWYSGKLKVTHAHQLALSTIYFSPWQVLYWYDKPGQFNDDPALDYWKDLPTCWDETRVLIDQIGRCVSIARKRGTEWFIGTINPAGGEIQIPLSFLEPGITYMATIYSDRDPDNAVSKAVRIETIQVDSTTILKPHIPANGGQAVHLIRAMNPR
ncbi:MAG: glycoside hydrolase family 97 protein [Phycisphaerae bacterium]|nr:glycoside hydrolase family 97 protein [Phycisphaerae bacterium]